MGATPIRSWALDGPVDSSFALPRGLTGRLAGRVMRWTSKQRELLDLIDVPDQGRILEVGYGPGALVNLLLQRFPTARICGVDPSSEMREMAARQHRTAGANGQVDLRVGTAAETGFSSEEFDQVVSANNVAFWPDLDAGLRELHRVIRPGGRIVVAWHSQTGPSPLARFLGLPEQTLDRLRAGLAEQFEEVRRHDLTHLVAFTGIRHRKVGDDRSPTE